MTFAIVLDARIDGFAAQHAVPAGDGLAAWWAARILQPDRHHQAMTAWALHRFPSSGCARDAVRPVFWSSLHRLECADPGYGPTDTGL